MNKRRFLQMFGITGVGVLGLRSFVETSDCENLEEARKAWFQAQLDYDWEMGPIVMGKDNHLTFSEKFKRHLRENNA